MDADTYPRGLPAAETVTHEQKQSCATQSSPKMTAQDHHPQSSTHILPTSRETSCGRAAEVQQAAAATVAQEPSAATEAVGSLSSLPSKSHRAVGAPPSRCPFIKTPATSANISWISLRGQRPVSEPGHSSARKPPATGAAYLSGSEDSFTTLDQPGPPYSPRSWSSSDQNFRESPWTEHPTAPVQTSSHAHLSNCDVVSPAPLLRFPSSFTLSQETLGADRSYQGARFDYPEELLGDYVTSSPYNCLPMDPPPEMIPDLPGSLSPCSSTLRLGAAMSREDDKHVDSAMADATDKSLVQHSFPASLQSQTACSEGMFESPAAAMAEEPYAQLIYRAFMSTPRHAMTLQEIYQWFREHTDKGKSDSKGWQNSIRHNLSMNGAFNKRDPKAPYSSGDPAAAEASAGDEAEGSSADPKKATEWVLAEWAVIRGVQSTTRYRKGGVSRRGAGGSAASPPSASRSGRSSAISRADDYQPSPIRAASGRMGGISTGRAKSRAYTALRNSRMQAMGAQCSPYGIYRSTDFGVPRQPAAQMHERSISAPSPEQQRLNYLEHNSLSTSHYEYPDPLSLLLSARLGGGDPTTHAYSISRPQGTMSNPTIDEPQTPPDPDRLLIDPHIADATTNSGGESSGSNNTTNMGAIPGSDIMYLLPTSAATRLGIDLSGYGVDSVVGVWDPDTGARYGGEWGVCDDDLGTGIYERL